MPRYDPPSPSVRNKFVKLPLLSISSRLFGKQMALFQEHLEICEDAPGDVTELLDRRAEPQPDMSWLQWLLVLWRAELGIEMCRLESRHVHHFFLPIL